MDNREGPGIGGVLAHVACCGLPLLVLLVVQAPVLLLYGGGLAVLGGVVFRLNRAWSRRRRYRRILLERRGKNAPGLDWSL